MKHIEKSRCRSNRYKVLCKKFIKYRENGRKLRCKNELIQKGMECASKFKMEQSNFDNREFTSTGTKKVISVKDIMKSRFYTVLQHKKNQVQTEIEDNNDIHDTDIVDDQDICRATTRPPRPSSTAECLRLIACLRGEQASAASWEPRPLFEATEMD